MDTKRITTDIDKEISKLKQVRAILTGVVLKKGQGRPKSTEPKAIEPRKRKLSAKGRAAISDAIKARWAKARKQSAK